MKAFLKNNKSILYLGILLLLYLLLIFSNFQDVKRKSFLHDDISNQPAKEKIENEVAIQH
ncbi:hypothetical protein [Zunongwangia endophytica]|uniref:Uncharacterized protein n=1 Tax=Zunongwangia endophytica TaxID=1808945 RepID=A0ABV8HEQ7_9FLAO|nr:hypothetical protein [Zunongwangia endophytica]MDN3593711.1 hypothetical protein [Zunongwangia endophytica]